MIVSMRGDDGEWNTAQVPMGRAVRDILDAIGVAHSTVTSADVAANIARHAGDTAFASRVSHACLLPKRLTEAPTRLRLDSDTAPTPLRRDSDTAPTSLRRESDTRSDASPTRVRHQSDTGPPVRHRSEMTRIEATRIVVDHAGEGAIVASLGHPTYDLFAAGDRRRNF